jgi:hypothetical protein
MLSVPHSNFENLIDFHKILYEHYAFRGHPTLIFFLIS